MSKGVHNFDKKVMKIGWNWFTKDQHDFHMKTKRAIYAQMNSGEVDWTMLSNMMAVDKSWLNIRPNEKKAPNYDLLKSVMDRYIAAHLKFKPDLLKEPKAYAEFMLMKPLVKKFVILFLTLYKEDIAYTDRIGGSIQFIYRNQLLFEGDDKIRGIETLYSWWKYEDWREVTKPVISFIFEKLIQYYKSNSFVRKSVNFVIDELIKGKARWRMWPQLDPPKWYPRGSGQVNYVVHNRERYKHAR